MSPACRALSSRMWAIRTNWWEVSATDRIEGRIETKGGCEGALTATVAHLWMALQLRQIGPPGVQDVYPAWDHIKPAARAIEISHAQLAETSFDDMLKITAVVLYFIKLHSSSGGPIIFIFPQMSVFG